MAGLLRKLAISLAGLALSTGLALAQSKITIAVGGSACLCYLPTILAERLGEYEKAGVKVELVDFKGGSQSLTAVLGGSADVVSGYFDHTVNLAAKNQLMQAFVVYDRYPGFSLVVGPKNTDTIKSVKDLANKRIGVSAPGSSTHMVVSHLLSKVGLTSNDVSIIGVGTSAAAVAAVQTGEIDAIINSDPVMTKLETTDSVNVIAETRTRKGTEGLFGGPYPEAGLYATAEFIAKNPNTIQALTNAIVRAELWMQKASVDDIAANVPEDHMLGDKALYLASYQKMREAHAPDGLITKEGAQIVLNVLAAFLPEVKATNIKVEDTYDNRFVEAALVKFQGKM